MIISYFAQKGVNETFSDPRMQKYKNFTKSDHEIFLKLCDDRHSKESKNEFLFNFVTNLIIPKGLFTDVFGYKIDMFHFCCFFSLL